MMTTDTEATITPPIEHREAMALAETAYARFADVVDGLAEDDWARPTDCEGWTVRDLVGHVVGAMRSAASMRELLSQQREIKGRVREHGGGETEHMTQVQIDRTAELDRPALTAECRALVTKATAGRRRTPAPMRRLVKIPVQMGTIDETWRLGYLIDVILTRDAWLHRVDLCRAIGADPVLSADHDGRIVADIVAEWARRHGRPYRLELTGPAGGTFTSGDAEAEALELDAVEFCRIASRRADGEGLLATEVPF
jgi:uncharacterized protein (TIGR03083 family)